MKAKFLLPILIYFSCILCPSCKKVDKKLILGKWQGQRLEIKQEVSHLMPKEDPLKIHYRFRDDGTYTSEYGNSRSTDGTYNIWYNRIYTKSNGKENAMGIASLSKDTLVFSFDDFDRILLYMTRNTEN